MGKAAFGTTISFDASAVAEVTDVGGPGIDREMIDITSHDSDGGWKEFVAGLIDGGQVDLEMNFTTENYDALLTLLAAGADDTAAIITWPTGEVTPSNAAFDCIISGLRSAAPVSGKISASCTVKVNGPITFTAGHS